MQEVVAGVRSPEFAGQVRMALPENVSVERFQRVAITAIQQEPSLITASRESLFRSLIRCAQDGLMPDGHQAALVKFGKDAVYMPMIGGFRDIAADHGWALDTQVVYANDEFDYELGAHPRLTHKPPRLDKERGDMIGAYAVGTHLDGRKIIEVFTKADVLKVKKASKTPTGPLWTTWENRAWEKSVGRRWFAKMPRGNNDQANARLTRVLAAADVDTEIPMAEPMTVEEANLNASLATTVVPADSGPDDTPVVVEDDGQTGFVAPPLRDEA